LNKKPRILIIENSVVFTGAFKAIYTSSLCLGKHYQFVFAIPKNSNVYKDCAQHFQTYELRFIELSKRLSHLFAYFPFLIYNSLKMKRIIDREQIKIVHINDYYNLIGVFIKILSPSTKIITHVRFLPSKHPYLLSCFWQLVAQMISEKVICMSESIHNELTASKKATVIYDRIIENVENFGRKQIPTRNSSIVKLLYLGHFIPGKGQDYALEAFWIAYKKAPNLRLRFVGGTTGLSKNSEFKKSLMIKTDEYGLGNVVTFDNQSNDVEKEIRKADILLNFSESESFSFTCMEALYYGTPLIASDCGGPAELFKHGESGTLVDNRDIKSMAAAIVQLATNPGLREKYISNGREYIDRKFSEINTTLKLKSIYDTFIG